MKCSGGDPIMRLTANHRRLYVLRDVCPTAEFLYAKGRNWFYRIKPRYVQNARTIGIDPYPKGTTVKITHRGRTYQIHTEAELKDLLLPWPSWQDWIAGLALLILLLCLFLSF
jgi:hypothetical protein